LLSFEEAKRDASPTNELLRRTWLMLEPITKQSADFALNEQILVERQQFNEAAARIVRLFE
jgi:hypothetical protein